MVKRNLYRWWLLCFLALGFSVSAQPVIRDSLVPQNPSSPVSDSASLTDYRPFTIGTIYITGNKKTKPYIIKRELPFHEGGSVNLTELVKGFEIGRQQLMNTHLFNEVAIFLKSFRGHVVDVNIEVKERWYIFPLPYLKPVDRNLSEWGKQGYSTDRLNYGFKFTHYNFTGRNDKLRIWLITGYTRQIQFQYEQPYADKNLKHGYKIGFKYGTNREVNYGTVDNQQKFVDSLSDVKNWSGTLEYTYRPGLRTFHSFRLSYEHRQVDEQVLQLNPKYFNTGTNEISYPELAYTINYYNVDYIPYPLTGWMGEASLTKRGLNSATNMWQIGLKFTKAWQVGKKTWFNWQGNGILRAPFDQPFINSQMFGYGDFYLRGLEKYVIDGVGGALFRHTLKRKLIHFDVPTGIKSTTHDHIPFTFYAKIFGDIGYAYNKSFPQNSYPNRMLYTAGFGIDMVTFYDFVLRLDYSINQFGQKGLFLHVKNEF